jgi:L-seryl-tRNA(Ser) seleniumtransferase
VYALAGLNGCCNIQIDLGTGLRGKRNHVTERLLTKLTGAEAAAVVNNNAAATFLILSVFCKGKKVMVSRGQLIEIGGSYRLPDCIEQSGSAILEVGTTNRTHLRDYEQALSEDIGAILRVNPSNYRIVGFTKAVPIEELVGLKKKQDVLIIDDLGCGSVVDFERFGLPHEPTVQESLQAGADLVCFSGDKLLGGAQAGIIVGRRDLVAKIKKHPLARILRVGKMTDVVLEHTLRLFFEPETLPQTHPTIRMLVRPLREVRRRADRLVRRIRRAGLSLQAVVRQDAGQVGGGSMPAVPIQTAVVALRSPALPAERLSRLLRQNEPPVVARISEQEVLLDVRTLLDGEDDTVFEALRRIAPAAPIPGGEAGKTL